VQFTATLRVQPGNHIQLLNFKGLGWGTWPPALKHNKQRVAVVGKRRKSGRKKRPGVSSGSESIGSTKLCHRATQLGGYKSGRCRKKKIALSPSLLASRNCPFEVSGQVSKILTCRVFKQRCGRTWPYHDGDIQALG